MSAINFSRIHCLAWSVCNLFAKLINITERNVYIIPRIFSHRLQWNNYHYVICWIICYSFAYLSIHYESYSSFLFILQQPNLIYTRDETRITTSLVPNLLNIYRNKKHRGNFSNRSDKSNEEWTEIKESSVRKGFCFKLSERIRLIDCRYLIALAGFPNMEFSASFPHIKKGFQSRWLSVTTGQAYPINRLFGRERRTKTKRKKERKKGNKNISLFIRERWNVHDTVASFSMLSRNSFNYGCRD